VPTAPARVKPNKVPMPRGSTHFGVGSVTMTCRHAPGDSSCSSHRDYVPPYDPYKAPPATPDASNYTIEEVERIGKHLVMKVKYPNCRSCSFEGVKVMVFLNVTEMQVIHWRKIDPHFRDPKSRNSKTEAPSPAARFPGSADGWVDALTYARGKDR